MSEPRADRIHQVVNDCLIRRANGESVSDEAVIAAHSDLMPELADQLRMLELVQTAEQQVRQSTISIRCPHCSSSTEMSADSDLSHVECSRCGSHFSLVVDDSGSLQHLKSVGRFELLEQLGVGAFGAVWSARDTQLDRVVAVKIPRKAFLSGEDTEKFMREARVAAQLSHPNIVRVHEVGREGERVYIVSDYVHGVEVGEWLADRRPSYREAAQLCATIAAALEHAHEAGVVHRDLKPSNIMIDADGQPHLMDFGLAKRDTGEVTMTVEGKLLGTPAYMSPEQASGAAHDADRRSDIYSLGVILFELLTGERPFRGSTRMLLHQILVEDAPSPRRLNGQIPRDLETVCLKCLEKDRSKRYQSAALLRDELYRCIRGEPVHARPITTPQKWWRWSRRNPTLAGMAMVILMTCLIGGSAVLWQWQRAEGLVETLRIQGEETRVQRDWAQWELYRASLMIANTSLELERADRARQALETAPEKFRGWEWHHFQSRVDQAIATVNTGIFQPSTVTFTRSGRGMVVQATDNFFIHGNPLSALRAESLALSSSGAIAASLHNDTITLFDTNTGEQLAQWKDSAVAYVLAVNSEGSHLVVKFRDDTLGTLNTKTGQLECAFEHDASGAEQCEIRGSRAMTKETSPGGSAIALWDIHTGRRIAVLESVNAEAFNGDGTVLAVGKGDPEPENTVEIWNAVDGQREAILEGHGGSVEAVGFHPEGMLLASGAGDNIVRIWNLATQQELHVLEGHHSMIEDLRFSPDGSLLASAGSNDQTVRLWNVETGALEATLLGHTNSITKVTFSADGSQVASADWTGQLRLWDVAAARRPAALEHGADVIDVAVNPKDGTIASSCLDGKLRVWDFQDRTPRVLFDTQGEGHLNCLTFSPDGKYLAFHRGWIESGEEQAGLNVCNLKTGQIVHKLAVPRIHGFLHLAFSPDATLLASPGQDGVIRVWKTESGEKVAEFKGHKGMTRGIAFNGDGTRLASASVKLRVGDLNSQTYVTAQEEHGSYVYDLAFSPDGQWIATASHDRTVWIWDVKTVTKIAVLPHGNHALALSFSPDGTRLAVGCRDSAIHVWDLKSMKEAAVLTGHQGPVHGVAFSSDGSWLASSSFDATVRIWDSTLRPMNGGISPK